MQRNILYPSILILLLVLVACNSQGETAVERETAVEETTTIADETASAVASPTNAVAESGDTTAAAFPTPFPASKYEDLNIVTLLPRDAIPAIDDPEFLSVAEADEAYDPDELVIGVEFNGEARAYSVPLLSNHEIVNDTVGGVKIAVTW